MSLSPLERSCAGIAVLLLRDEIHHRAGPCFVLIRDDGILLITIRQIPGFFLSSSSAPCSRILYVRVDIPLNVFLWFFFSLSPFARRFSGLAILRSVEGLSENERVDERKKEKVEG